MTYSTKLKYMINYCSPKILLLNICPQLGKEPILAASTKHMQATLSVTINLFLPLSPEDNGISLYYLRIVSPGFFFSFVLILRRAEYFARLLA